MSDMQNPGKCVIFSAPSGAGKTTIVHYLLNQELGLAFSVSACSRDPRVTEKDGRDYHFLGIDGFKKAIENGEFAEWEEVYANNFYGTLNAELDRIWKAGKTVIFDVDVVGGLNLKRIFGKQALAVFVQPPSFEAVCRSQRSERFPLVCEDSRPLCPLRHRSEGRRQELRSPSRQLRRHRSCA